MADHNREKTLIFICQDSGFIFYVFLSPLCCIFSLNNESIKASNVLIVKQKSNDGTLEALVGRVSACLWWAGSSSLSSSVFLLNVTMFDTSAHTCTHVHFHTDASDAEEKRLTAVVAASNLHVTSI